VVLPRPTAALCLLVVWWLARVGENLFAKLNPVPAQEIDFPLSSVSNMLKTMV
jgi:hypothetical protein